MSLKRIADNESGITYALEAIIGILLIIGAIIYMTGNMPYTAQKTGEHSKVQLMNIGRDTIDLTSITPVFEISQGEPIEMYILKADKYANILPGDILNFTVYYAGNPSQKVMNQLNFNATPLIIGNTLNITGNVSFQNDGTGHQSWLNVPSPPGIVPSTTPPEKNFTYSIQAYDSNSPAGVSNFVTIKVGYYNLTSRPTIAANSYVSGVVTNASGSGVSGLTIRIWGYQGINLQIILSSATTTIAGGNFSFQWPGTPTIPNSAGAYLIQAIDTQGNESNMQVIEYQGRTGNNLKPLLCASNSGASSCDSIFVTQRGQVSLYMSDSGTFPGNYFYVNYIEDASANGPDIGQYITTFNTTNATFYANVPSGIYYVASSTPGFVNPWSSPIRSNIIVIYVLPIYAGPIEDTCVNATELNMYMRNYTPPNVNYNLYLIGPTGRRFTECPGFESGQFINGYPTAEAVTVSKLFHIKYPPPPYTPIIDNITEFRMVLWYK
jgi:hypothetical protein